MKTIKTEEAYLGGRETLGSIGMRPEFDGIQIGSPDKVTHLSNFTSVGSQLCCQYRTEATTSIPVSFRRMASAATKPRITVRCRRDLDHLEL